MKPLPLEIPLPSLQINDNRMRNMAKIIAEILTEETAELLERLSYTIGNVGTDRDCKMAFELAAKIRGLIRSR